jgi:hypothetical protein
MEIEVKVTSIHTALAILQVTYQLYFQQRHSWLVKTKLSQSWQD